MVSNSFKFLLVFRLMSISWLGCRVGHLTKGRRCNNDLLYKVGLCWHIVNKKLLPVVKVIFNSQTGPTKIKFYSRLFPVLNQARVQSILALVILCVNKYIKRG